MELLREAGMRYVTDHLDELEKIVNLLIQNK
jgi:hypothetical protein